MQSYSARLITCWLQMTNLVEVVVVLYDVATLHCRFLLFVLVYLIVCKAAESTDECLTLFYTHLGLSAS